MLRQGKWRGLYLPPESPSCISQSHTDLEGPVSASSFSKDWDTALTPRHRPAEVGVVSCQVVTT